MNKPNCIAIPEALKGQLEAEGELEVSYKLTEDESGSYIEVTSVEGQPVASEPESPESRLKGKVGYTEEAPNIA